MTVKRKHKKILFKVALLSKEIYYLKRLVQKKAVIFRNLLIMKHQLALPHKDILTDRFHGGKETQTQISLHIEAWGWWQRPRMGER